MANSSSPTPSETPERLREALAFADIYLAACSADGIGDDLPVIADAFRNSDLREICGALSLRILEERRPSASPREATPLDYDAEILRRINAYYRGALVVGFKSHEEGRPHEPVTLLYRSALVEIMGVTEADEKQSTGEPA